MKPETVLPACCGIATRVLLLTRWCRKSSPEEAGFRGYFYLQNLDQEIRSIG